MQALIRRATPADAATLVALGTFTFIETFGHLYTPEDLQAFLDESHSEAAYAALRKGVIDYDRRHGYRGPEAFASLAADSASAEQLDEVLDRGDPHPGVAQRDEERDDALLAGPVAAVADGVAR